MEIVGLNPSPSLGCLSRVSSPLTPFSDHSHILFYGPVFRHRVAASSLTRHSSIDFQSLAPARVQQLPAATSSPIGVAGGQDVVEGLDDLMARLEQKRKERKGQMKELKNALKSRKQKLTESKDCSSSSSSESESSDSECENADLEPSQQEQAVLTAAGSTTLDPLRASSNAQATQRYPSSDIRDCSPSALHYASSVDRSCVLAKPSKPAGKIEVCVGGNCKKAGSQQLLSSLRAQIPSDSAVEAVPCKCMGRCKMSINVRVQKEETNPLNYSHIRNQDAGLLLSHHFNVGPTPTGLPSLGPHRKPCVASEYLTALL